jgi:hypothetical protein
MKLNLQRFYAESDDAGGTALEDAPPQPGGLASRMASLRGEQEPAKPPAEKKPESAPIDSAPVETKPEDTGKPEAPKKSKIEKTKPDPLLDMLSGEAAKAEVKKETPAVDPAKEAEIVAATKGMSPKASDNFRLIASARDAAETRAADLQRQLDAIKQGPQFTPEIQAKLERLEAIEKEYGEMSSVMEKIGAERSPTYQNKFVKGRQELINKAKALVRKNGGDDVAFEEAIKLTGSDRNDAISTALVNINAMDSSRIGDLLTKLDVLDEEGEAFITNARESLLAEEKAQQQAELQRRQQVAKDQDENFMKVVNTMLHKFPDDHPLAAEANPMVDEVIAGAKEFLFKNEDFGEFVKAAVSHRMYPKMIEKLGAATKRIAELETMIEEYESAGPDVGNGSVSTPDGAKEAPKGLAGRFSQAMAGS